MPERQKSVTAIAAALRRRGPDDTGSWHEPRSGLSLVHTRLSIQDLSSAGSQPMRSPSQRWTIVFNGEIYNFKTLARELEARGYRFIGHSDTEVLLAGFECWGLNATMKRATGMFALAAFDSEAQVLHLARDRMGEKPLYYGFSRGRFIFGSTLAALRVTPGWAGQIDVRALSLYLRYRYVPAPSSIYEGISKLPPGTIATIAVGDGRGKVKIDRYWGLDEASAGTFSGDREEAVTVLDELLGEVVQEQSIADRSLGVFLSGGIDSTLVTAAMCEQSTDPVKSFTVAFEDPEFNEGVYARAVAEHLNTEHTEIVLPPSVGIDLIPELPEVFDEPFADASQLPTMVVSAAARQQVVVALSGDGGDESFGGYTRYADTLSQYDRLRDTPLVLRSAGSSALSLLRRGPLEVMATHIGRRFTRRLNGRRAGAVFSRLQQEWSARSVLDLYQYSLMQTREQTVALNHRDRRLDLTQYEGNSGNLRRMIATDLNNYLPDDILVKVDRAAMHYSLESRAPLLDRRIVEFAWTLPEAFLMKGGEGKQPLRELLSTKVPRALIERPKRGFAVPLGDWLKTDLRDWAESLLSVEALNRNGLLDTGAVRTRWEQHLTGVWDNSDLCWTVLQLQSWIEGQRT